MLAWQYSTRSNQCGLVTTCRSLAPHSVQGSNIVTAMELCCTSLDTVLQQHDCPLLPSIVKRLVSDLLKGLHAMHSHGVH